MEADISRQRWAILTNLLPVLIASVGLVDVPALDAFYAFLYLHEITKQVQQLLHNDLTDGIFSQVNTVKTITDGAN